MPKYAVRLKTRGKLSVREIEAPSKEEAARIARGAGQIISVDRKYSLLPTVALSLEERQVFFTRMAAMLDSRVGTSEALTLMRDTFTGKIQEVAGRLITFVEAGDSLEDAVEKVGVPDFPPTTVALVRAGSRSGASGRALKDAASFENELAAARSTARSGLMSGIGTFLLAAGIVIGSNYFLGPYVMKAMGSFGKAASGIDTGWVTLTGDIITYLMIALLVIGGALFMLSGVLRRIAPVVVDGLILRIPFYRDLVLARDNFVTLYGLALLVRSGVRTEDALKLSADATRPGALRRDLLQAGNFVRTGRPWPQAMTTFHATDKASLLCAVDREQVARTIQTLADQYKTLYAQRIKTFVPIINLVAALFMGMAGFMIFFQTIYPMLQLTDGIMGSM